VVTSGKLKIRKNYGQSVLVCFVSIASDCDVTVVGLQAERGLTNQSRLLNRIGWSEFNMVQCNSAWTWFNFWSRFSWTKIMND